MADARHGQEMGGAIHFRGMATEGKNRKNNQTILAKKIALFHIDT